MSVWRMDLLLFSKIRAVQGSKPVFTDSRSYFFLDCKKSCLFGDVLLLFLKKYAVQGYKPVISFFKVIVFQSYKGSYLFGGWFYYCSQKSKQFRALNGVSTCSMSCFMFSQWFKEFCLYWGVQKNSEQFRATNWSLVFDSFKGKIFSQSCMFGVVMAPISKAWGV